MLKITKVKRNSIAAELGLEVGDIVTAFDAYPCEDELDYLYYVETDGFTMTVRDHRSGEEHTVEVGFPLKRKPQSAPVTTVACFASSIKCPGVCAKACTSKTTIMQ